MEVRLEISSFFVVVIVKSVHGKRYNIKYAFRVDLMNELIVVEIHYVGNERSWFAIGFSDYGELKPADYCVLWPDWHQQIHLQVKCLVT